MSDEVPPRAAAVAAVAFPLHCAHCRQHNELTAEQCKRCHAPLWVICKRCGKRCPRTYSRCARCMDLLNAGVLHAVKRAVRKLVRKATR
ncbi:MAG: hypothetical protein RL514_2490 [Verrucomicrobiota bacterium]|jgi:predicted amidophosphoribosyltransferase